VALDSARFEIMARFVVAKKSTATRSEEFFFLNSYPHNTASTFTIDLQNATIDLVSSPVDCDRNKQEQAMQARFRAATPEDKFGLIKLWGKHVRLPAGTRNLQGVFFSRNHFFSEIFDFSPFSKVAPFVHLRYPL
jgi:hypothetical protein